MTGAQADYVYIAGRGHSGSTLLELLLGAHPAIASMGELEKLSLQFARDHAPYPGLCSCGKRPNDCETWRAVADAVRERCGVDLGREPFRFRVSDVGLEEDFGLRALPHWLLHHSSRWWRYLSYRHRPRAVGRPGQRRPCHQWVANRLFVADVIRHKTGARTVVDASKDYLAMRDIYDSDGATVKILFISRDVLGTVSSELREGQTVTSAAKAWVKVNARILELLEGVAETDWMHVRYEDLCRDTVGTAERLCRFIGYEYDPAMADLSRRHHHTIGGNRVRFRAIGSVEEDLSWKQTLSAADVRAIERIAGPLAKRLGY